MKLDSVQGIGAWIHLVYYNELSTPPAWQHVDSPFYSGTNGWTEISTSPLLLPQSSPNGYMFMYLYLWGSGTAWFDMARVESTVMQATWDGNLLTSRTDGNGNTAAYTWGGDATSNPSGNPNNLVEAKDPLNNKTTYKYNRANHVIETQSPKHQGTTGKRTYTYDVPENLSQVRDSLPGLVGEWRLDEGTDAVAHDTSGRGSDGTLRPAAPYSPTWVDGVPGKAVHFDGVDDHVDLASPAALYFGTGDFSLEAWVKPGAQSGARGTVLGKGERWRVDVDNSGVISADFSVTTPGGATEQLGWWTGATSIRDDNWHHVLVTYDRDGFGTIYLDGAVAPGGTNPQNISALSQGNVDNDWPVHIGNRTLDQNGNTNYWPFNGDIDEVRIYNRALSSSDVAGAWSSTYDTYGQRLTMRDPNASGRDPANPTGLTYDYTYNGYGLVTDISTPKGGIPDHLHVTMAYDNLRGLLTARTDARGQMTCYTYDNLYRLKTVTYLCNTVPYSVYYTYDANDNRTTMVDARGLTTYEYHATNRLKKVTEPDWRYTEYYYDGVGNMATLRNVDGYTVQYAYDTNRRPLQDLNPYDGAYTYFRYDNGGRLVWIEYPGVNRMEYSYKNGVGQDQGDRLMKLEVVRNGGLLKSFSYTYDWNGNITTNSENDGSATSYAYSLTDQLLGAVRTGTTPYTQTFTYDPSGNRKTMARGGTTFTKQCVSRWTHQAATKRRCGSRKKPRIKWGSFCSRCKAATALLLRSPWAVAIPARPMRSALTFFQTHSSGLSSGEYAGSWNRRSRPWVEATNFLTALDRWTGWPSTTRNTGPVVSCISRLQKLMNVADSNLPS